MLGLSKQEERTLRKLKTPILIQDFIDTLPINHEKHGDTHYSPRKVLREKKAHCIEGALLAATALWLSGEPPLLMNMRTRLLDDEHVIALYKKNGYWGSISKTNHIVLRFRDPIYRTLRELALSYFHEYYREKDGVKTFISYSGAFDLRRLGEDWVTSEEDLWLLDDLLNNMRHYPLIPKMNKKYIRNASKFEKTGLETVEWKKRNKRT